MNKNKINPALNDIKDLTGKWEMVLSHPSFLPDPETTMKGTASFEWFEDGEFLVLRQGMKESGVPWATWLIGRDEDAKNYTILYYDDRGSSRVYEMSFESRIWKIWRNAPEFTQRFTGKLNAEKTLIEGYWEKSKDGKTWHHDFDLTYKRKDA